MDNTFLLTSALTLLAAAGPCLAQGTRTPSAVPDIWQGAAWVKVTGKAAFSPRDTAEDAVFNGKLWLSNGYYHGNVLHRDLWCSGDGLTWTLACPETPYDGYSEMVVHNNTLWAVKASVWSSPDGISWTQRLAKTPFGARGYGELLVYNDRMWQLGSGSDVWSSADGVEWTCIAKDTPFGKRIAAAVVAFDGKLWLLGGRITAANTPPEKGYPKFTTFNDVWCSTDGATWNRVLEHAPWSPRMWFISKVYRGRIWIVGGYDNVNSKNLGDVWYSENGSTWHEFTSDPSFSPRHESTCYVYDDSLWVVAGNSWPVKNDAWRLTLPKP